MEEYTVPGKEFGNDKVVVNKDPAELVLTFTTSESVLTDPPELVVAPVVIYLVPPLSSIEVVSNKELDVSVVTDTDSVPTKARDRAEVQVKIDEVRDKQPSSSLRQITPLSDTSDSDVVEFNQRPE